METRHPQVPVLDFECDEEIAELITLMNNLEIETLLSCQDNDGRRGTVRRVWVEIYAEDLLPFLELLNRPDEAIDDPESLSGRMVNEWVPADEDSGNLHGEPRLALRGRRQPGRRRDQPACDQHPFPAHRPGRGRSAATSSLPGDSRPAPRGHQPVITT
jgi:hypothetical protein